MNHDLHNAGLHESQFCAITTQRTAKCPVTHGGIEQIGGIWGYYTWFVAGLISMASLELWRERGTNFLVRTRN